MDDVRIRSYRSQDLDPVLELLTLTLGGGPAGSRPPSFFRWKHLENPFGPSHLLLAEAGGRVVGLRAFMRWGFEVGGTPVRAVTAVDTATHPDFQGRGIFSKLTLQALEDLRGDAQLVYNTPNDQSMPGYLKMGWRFVGRIPVRLRIHRPIRFAASLRSIRAPRSDGEPEPRNRAIRAAEALDRPGLGSLLEQLERPPGFRTRIDEPFLRWRYAAPPLLDYRAAVVEGAAGPAGVGFFRLRPRGRLWEASIADLLVRRGDVRTATRLLRSIVGSTAADHLTCSFPSGSVGDRAARRVGFLPAPGGVRFVVNPLDPGLAPDPTLRASWGLTLGDLEVF
jgi:GNAT superfamily N-acetyltransferase